MIPIVNADDEDKDKKNNTSKDIYMVFCSDYNYKNIKGRSLNILLHMDTSYNLGNIHYLLQKAFLQILQKK